MFYTIKYIIKYVIKYIFKNSVITYKKFSDFKKKFSDYQLKNSVITN